MTLPLMPGMTPRGMPGVTLPAPQPKASYPAFQYFQCHETGEWACRFTINKCGFFQTGTSNEDADQKARAFIDKHRKKKGK